jgi:mono/diheme cytochrome c family protein
MSVRFLRWNVESHAFSGVLSGLVLAAVSATAASAQFPQAPHDPDPLTPTYYKDVLPIIQENCQACHQPAGLNLGGMVAPMSFLTYEETRPWSRVISKVVSERRMPPWHAAQQFRGRFIGERFLDDAEIATLVAWADAGAPAGDAPAGYVPPEVPKSDGPAWALGEPDLVLKLDEPFKLEEGITDIYVTLTATIPDGALPEHRWVKSVEYRPGPHVHHILRGMGGLAPGNQPQIYENGYGMLMEKGPRKIEFDMHYNKPTGPGTEAWDQTEVGIRFMQPDEIIKYRTTTEMFGIFDFLIPPGAKSYSSSREYAFRNDAYITGFTPHMHLRGKSALFEITYPDGRHEQLLHVPKYDFSWQHNYEFKEPVFAPRGTVVRMTLWWDNSADNPHNPDPTVAVRFGEPTTDEMAFGFMQYRDVQEFSIRAGDPITDEVRRAFAPRGMVTDGAAAGAQGRQQ